MVKTHVILFSSNIYGSNTKETELLKGALDKCNITFFVCLIL